jgi:hypothetical protein
MSRVVYLLRLLGLAIVGLRGATAKLGNRGAVGLWMGLFEDEGHLQGADVGSARMEEQMRVDDGQRRGPQAFPEPIRVAFWIGNDLHLSSVPSPYYSLFLTDA